MDQEATGGAGALPDDRSPSNAERRQGISDNRSEEPTERTHKGKVFSIEEDTGYIVVGDTYYKFKAADVVGGDAATKLSDRLSPNDEVEVQIGARGASCVRPINREGSQKRGRRLRKKTCTRCGKERTEDGPDPCPCTGDGGETVLLDRSGPEQRGAKEQTQPRKLRQRSYSCVLDYGSHSYIRVSGLPASGSSEVDQPSVAGRYMPRLGLSALRRTPPQSQPLRRGDYGGSQRTVPPDLVPFFDPHHVSANRRPQQQAPRRPRSNLASLASLTSAAVGRLLPEAGSERSAATMRALGVAALRQALPDDDDDLYIQPPAGSTAASAAGILRPLATRRRFDASSYPIPPPFDAQGRSHARPPPRGRALLARPASSARPSPLVHPSAPPPAVPNQSGAARQPTPSTRPQRRDPRLLRRVPSTYLNDIDYAEYVELGHDLADCYLEGYYPTLAMRREQVRNARAAALAAAAAETVRRRHASIDWSDPLFRLVTIVDRPPHPS